MTDREPLLFARVPPGLRDWVDAEAQRRFGRRDGFRSAVIRRAVETERDLRASLGPAYEPTIAGLLGRGGRGTEDAA